MTRPIGGWRLSLDTLSAQRLPVFLRIARAIAHDARRGRLVPGSRLPGSRELAAGLGVHRNTVLAAYRELSAEGFLVTHPGRGTFIADALPDVRPGRMRGLAGDRAGRSRAHRLALPLELPPGPPPLESPPPHATLLYGGLADLRLLPRAALARAYRRALRARPDVLGYGDPRGEPRLRTALAGMLRATRGLAVSPDELLITRGSQMALALLGRLLLRPGDAVAVEAHGYSPAWRALAHNGARLLPVPVDRDGLVVSVLRELCKRTAVRAVYVTPHHQYPTTAMLSAARRMELLSLARQRRFAIIEDDFDHEFHYEGRPVLPLAAVDDTGHVLYVGTLSKVFAPALRVGYLVAPSPLREAALGLRFDFDRQGDRVTENALAELIEDGELQRHLWRARRVYRARRDHAVARLRRAFGPRLEFGVPHGGMALWARVARELPVSRWLSESRARGVWFQPGRLFSFEGDELPYARIGFGGQTEEEFAAAVKKLRASARAAIGPNHS